MTFDKLAEKRWNQLKKTKNPYRNERKNGSTICNTVDGKTI